MGVQLISELNTSEPTKTEYELLSADNDFSLNIEGKSENTDSETVYFSKGFRNYLESLRYKEEGKSETESEQQSSQLCVERFDIHSKKSYSSVNSDPQPINAINPNERFRLLASINDSYFESGVLNEADKYFEELIHKYGSITQPLVLLSDITNHSIDNEHVLEGVLHILSNYDYSEINPIGISIVLAAVVNHSPVVQDLLIGCFERWDSLDGIDILNKLVLDTPWLIQYRDEVVNQLQQVNGV